MTTLADDLAQVLAAVEPVGLPCREAARRVRRRRADVLAVLRGDGRFVHDGRGRGSRWRVVAGTPLRASQAHMGTELVPWPYLDASGVPIVGRRAARAS